MVHQVFVMCVASNVLGFLGSDNVDHIQRSVVFGFALLVSFPVLPVRLHLGNIHIMDQLGVVLETLEANQFTLAKFIVLFVLVLSGHTQKIISKVRSFSW